MTQYEKMGGTYTKQGDYYLSNLILSAEEKHGKEKIPAVLLV